MKRRRYRIAGLMLMTALSAAGLFLLGQPLWRPIYTKLTGGQSIQQAIDRYGPDAEQRLASRFLKAELTYPPAAIALIGIKEDKQLELWARTGDQRWKPVHNYPVLAASGGPGPKLREGDRQVPEGLYRIESLNPNSSYHLSMKLNYPNAFDRARAQEEDRGKPGTNIFIHGKAASVGCLAMGDPAIEELFVLTHLVSPENVSVLLLPYDPRDRPLQPTRDMPAWTAELYQSLHDAMTPFMDRGDQAP